MRGARLRTFYGSRPAAVICLGPTSNRLHPMSLDQVRTISASNSIYRHARADPVLGALARMARRRTRTGEAGAALHRLDLVERQSIPAGGAGPIRRITLQRLLSAEDFRHYKPDPEVYLGAASALGLEAHQVMMVAAHKGDLRARRPRLAGGLRRAAAEKGTGRRPRTCF